jgi:hypothetical protein
VTTFALPLTLLQIHILQLHWLGGSMHMVVSFGLKKMVIPRYLSARS